jgi:uncharacterized protein (DUF885 family)
MNDRRFILLHTVAALLWAAHSASALAAPKKKKKPTKPAKKSKKSTKSKKKATRPAPPPPPPPPQITRLEDKEALRQVFTIGAQEQLNAQPKDGARLFHNNRSSQVATLRRLRQNILSLPRTLYHQKDRVIYDAVLWETNLKIEGADRFGVGGYFRPDPYLVTPFHGLYRTSAFHLEQDHDVSNEADANAYLEKLNNLSKGLAQETDLMKAEQASFGLMPDFLIKSTLLDLKGVIDHDVLTHPLTLGLEKKARKAGLATGWGEKAVSQFESSVSPQLELQFENLRAQLGRAKPEASIRHHPKGEAYYDWALRFYTGSDLGARDLHELGLKRLLNLQSSLDTRLRGLGFASGSVAERLKVLRIDGQYIYPDSSDGRTQLMADCQTRIRNIDALLMGRLRRSGDFALGLKTAKVFGAPSHGGYDYFVRRDDVISSGLMLIDVDEWLLRPQWQHTAILSQVAGLGRHALSDVIRNDEFYGLGTLISSPSMIEGWVHYAQDLADEAGLYDEDVIGKIGHLEQAYEQAVLSVMDSGIHHLGWSREQAIVKLAIQLGSSAETARRFVDTIVACPGKLISGFYGRSRWQALRAASRQRLGARFDQSQFHYVGLSSGPISMDHIELIYKNEKMV